MRVSDLRICLLALAASSVLCGQQTIFDVPSADVSKRGDWFYQHQTVARTWSPGKRWIQTNSFGYGVGKNSELDVTVFNLDAHSPESTLGSFGWKTSLPVSREGSRLKSRLVIGDMVEAVGNEEGRARLGNWSYLMWNTVVHRTATKLTAGGFHGTTTLFGRNVFNFLGGIEQPVSSRWTVQADWLSGKHELGYVVPGIVYRPWKRWMISLGYQFPNPGSGGYRAVVLELTRN